MVIYQEELFEDCIEEMKPFLEEHHKEAGLYSDLIDLDPNYELYSLMNKTGVCHMFTARDDDILIGYCVTFIQPHPHCKNENFAVNDIVYVGKEYRHTEVASEMISELELIMKQKGVTVMTFTMKTFKTFESLLDSLDFDKSEVIFTKYIKEQ